MANIRTEGYHGFEVASSSYWGNLGSGFMIWSGSKSFSSSLDGLIPGLLMTTYSGVGMEAVLNSESYFRFSASSAGSGLTIRAQSFFLGSADSFVCGSGDGTIAISSSNFFLDEAGSVTMQGTITAEAGDIGGFNIDSEAMWSDNLKLVLSGSTGAISASSGRLGKWEILGATIQSEMKFTQSGNYHSKRAAIKMVASGADSVTQPHAWIRVQHPFSDFGYPFTEVYGMGTGGGLRAFASYSLDDVLAGLPAREVFHLGTRDGLDDNQIGGWKFDHEKITGGAMIIRKDGTIESDGFVSNLAGSGFRLTAASGGFLECENARIRGTLSTAVFEKEAVNAVGGQLYVANSTTLTGSTFPTTTYGAPHQPSGYTSSEYPPIETTLSCVNVTGFTEGEILTAKKVHDTGFGTEYMLVHSSSRNDPGSGTDFSGQLYVQRGYGDSWTGDSGSLGDAPQSAQAYSGSQVIVSTGKLGTGYIRLNANPNDQYSPYIQIVERTGSDIYDVKLVAQLGDLGGITDNSFTDGVTGYGLYTQNGYFKGKIEVSSLPKPPGQDRLLGYWPLDSLEMTDASGNNSGSASYVNGGMLLVSQSLGGSQKALECTDDHKIDLAINNLTTADALANFHFVLSFWYKPTHSSTSATILRWKTNTVNDSDVEGPWDSYINHIGYTGAPVHHELQVKINMKNAAGDWRAITSSTPLLEDDVPVHLTLVANVATDTLRWYKNGVAHTGSSVFTSSYSGENDSLQHGLPPSYQELFLWYNDCTGEQISDIKLFTGSLDPNEIQANYFGLSMGGGRTVIDGGKIQTGKIESSNFGTLAGSQINLDKGTINFGGTLTPMFEVNEYGHITASAGKIAGWEIDSAALDGGKMHIHKDGFISASGPAPEGWSISSSQDSTDPGGFISSSNFKVRNTGEVTMSAGLITGDVDILGGLTIGDLENSVLSASAFYEDFSTAIDTNRWNTGNLTDTQTAATFGATEDGVATERLISGSYWKNSSTTGWKSGGIAKTTFLRSENPTLVLDFINYDSSPRFAFGWVPEQGNYTTAITTTDNYDLLEHAIVFGQSSGDISVYRSGGEYGGTNALGNNVFANEVDKDWRATITLLPGGGAQFHIYIDTDYSNPAYSYTDTGGGTTQKLRPAIFTYYSAATSGYFPPIFTQMGVNAPLPKTTITGAGIKTGKIASQEVTANVGSEIDLDAGKMALGGSIAGAEAKMDFDGEVLRIRSGSGAASAVLWNSLDGAFDGGNQGKVLGSIGIPSKRYSITAGSCGGAYQYGFHSDSTVESILTSNQMYFNNEDTYLVIVYTAGAYNQGNSSSTYVHIKFVIDIVDPAASVEMGGDDIFDGGVDMLRRTFTIRESIGYYPADTEYVWPPGQDGNSKRRIHYPGIMVIKHNNCDNDYDQTPLRGRYLKIKPQFRFSGTGADLVIQGFTATAMNQHQLKKTILALSPDPGWLIDNEDEATYGAATIAPQTYYTGSSPGSGTGNHVQYHSTSNTLIVGGCNDEYDASNDSAGDDEDFNDPGDGG